MVSELLISSLPQDRERGVMEEVETMLQTILARMEGLDSRLRMLELRRLKERGNYFEYVEAFVALVNQIELSDEDQVKMFVEGLTNPNHRLISVLSPRTLQQAISYGRALTTDIDPKATDLEGASSVEGSGRTNDRLERKEPVQSPNAREGMDCGDVTRLASDKDDGKERLETELEDFTRGNVVSAHQCQEVKYRKWVHILPVDGTLEGITENLFDTYLKPYLREATDFLLKEMQSKGMMDEALEVQRIKVLMTPNLNIWLRFLPPERVLPFGCKDNFGKMGDTGPCGPCTEVHYDRIGNHNASSLVNNNNPTCIEIWKLVFIRFNRENDGSLKPLSAKHIDTGMDFERLSPTLLNKMNYDTDVFMPIFDVIQQVTRAMPCAGKVGKDDKVDRAYRVVTDHIRTLSFAIGDGSCPDNEDREDVCRCILRQVVWYGSEVLKALEVFFNGLMSMVVRVMGDVFPELKQLEVLIREIIAGEDSSFRKTWHKGIENFKKAAQDVEGKTLSGLNAPILWNTDGFFFFLMYNTDGFSLDLTQLMAGEKVLLVDINGFIIRDDDATYSLHKKGIGPADDFFKLIWCIFR